jgi:hypothetical protein
MVKTRYDFELLKDYVEKTGVVLSKNYENEHLTRDIRIEGHCLGENCSSSFSKTFRCLIKNGGYCDECIMKNRKIKIKKTCLEKYGTDYPLQNDEIQKKMKETNKTRYGVEYVFQNEKVREKQKNTCLERYGVDHVMKIEETKEKIKNTCLERYGVENPRQSEEINEKCKKTCLERYGVENPAQLEKTKEKALQTNIERYGVEHPAQLEKTKEQKKQNFLNKYGVDNPLKLKAVHDKQKQTCLDKYGVEYPLQNSEIFEKQFNNSFKLKEVILPSGNIIKVQGYEPYCINDLLKTYDESDIKNGACNVPEIWYNDVNGIKHRHIVDFYISSINKCIEVKSTWTLIKENVFIKQKAAKLMGYDYEIWVYDNKGDQIKVFV